MLQAKIAPLIFHPQRSSISPSTTKTRTTPSSFWLPQTLQRIPNQSPPTDPEMHTYAPFFQIPPYTFMKFLHYAESPKSILAVNVTTRCIWQHLNCILLIVTPFVHTLPARWCVFPLNQRDYLVELQDIHLPNVKNSLNGPVCPSFSFVDSAHTCQFFDSTIMVSRDMINLLFHVMCLLYRRDGGRRTKKKNEWDDPLRWWSGVSIRGRLLIEIESMLEGNFAFRLAGSVFQAGVN